MNVSSIMGGKVHLADVDSPVPFPLCNAGSRNTVTRYRETAGEVDCKECSGILKRRAERLAREAEGESDMMAGRNDVTTPEGEKVIEQINANIERARSLAEADNADALKELGEETETLIASLAGKGSIAVKKEKRDAFSAAAQAEPAAKSTEVAKPETAAPADFTSFEGVSELVAMGAEKAAEGVRLHIKTSSTAKEIASIILDMWRRIPNKDGHPDITGTSDPAKKASSAMYKMVGEALAGEDGYDVEEAVKKLIRSVQTQRTDVRAQYLRSLDEDSEEAEAERKHFGKLLAGKPDDVPVSAFLAGAYGVSLKGEIEKARERWRKQNQLDAGQSSAEPEPEESPDERVRALVQRLTSDVRKAQPTDFEKASEEVKTEVRDQLNALYKAVKEMIAATL